MMCLQYVNVHIMRHDHIVIPDADRGRQIIALWFVLR